MKYEFMMRRWGVFEKFIDCFPLVRWESVNRVRQNTLSYGIFERLRIPPWTDFNLHFENHSQKIWWKIINSITTTITCRRETTIGMFQCEVKLISCARDSNAIFQQFFSCEKIQQFSLVSLQTHSHCLTTGKEDVPRRLKCSNEKTFLVEWAWLHMFGGEWQSRSVFGDSEHTCW